MDLDALLHHHFGTTDIDTLDDAGIEVGRDRLLIAFGLERDPGRRFAIWALLHAIGDAPDPAQAFKNPGERRAAQDYARGTERMI